MKYNTLNLGQIEALVNKLGGMEGVQKFLSGELIVASPTKASDLGTTLPLIMDCTRSLKEMIKAGRYNWTNSDIKDKNFPITEKGVFNTEAVLVHYNKVMKTEDILRDMESKGLVQGKIEHLLAVGEKYPNLQRDFPIVALGSSWQDPVGDRVVPYLRGYGGRRYLYLNWIGVDWDESYRFLALRK